MQSKTVNTSYFFLAGFILISSLQGCSLFGTTAAPSQETTSATSDQAASDATQTSKVSVDNLAEKKGAALSDVEVLWQVPTETVEGFVIHYGPNLQKLDQEAKVFSKDLEKIEDPKHGSVYRYVLGGIPLNQTVFISVAAFNGDEISGNSSVFEVRGESGL